MNRERELLERALKVLENRKDEVEDWGAYADEYFQKKWDYKGSITQYDPLIEEIRTFRAAEPEAEPMTEEEIENVFFSRMGFVSGYLEAFTKGFRSAEKHHGIGRSNT